MPLYEYDCPECGRFEILQKVSDNILKLCPNCLEKGIKSKVTRVVSAAAFHLKGTGWYKTDYASSSSSGGSSGKSSSNAKGTKASETKSEPAKSTDVAKVGND